MHRFLISAAVIGLTTHTAQAESRQLDAHEHGVGLMNIAFEGDRVAIELEAPGADIVGFEHPPESAEDRAKVEDAIAHLAKPLDLFVIPDAAGCTVVEAKAALIGEDDHDGDHSEHGHDDHAEHKDEDHAEHGHDDHAEHKDEDHAEHGHGDHDDHADAEIHSEFRAEYALSCAAPEKIDQIAFKYFEQFANARELEVQLISDKGTKGFEIERDDPVLSLSGSI